MEEKFLTQGRHVQLVISLDDLRKVFNELQDEREAQKQAENTYLSPGEVCKLFRISKSTLWRWKRDKYLSPVKVGNKKLYLKSDVEKVQ